MLQYRWRIRIYKNLFSHSLVQVKRHNNSQNKVFSHKKVFRHPKINLSAITVKGLVVHRLKLSISLRIRNFLNSTKHFLAEKSLKIARYLLQLQIFRANFSLVILFLSNTNIFQTTLCHKWFDGIIRESGEKWESVFSWLGCFISAFCMLKFCFCLLSKKLIAA